MQRPPQWLPATGDGEVPAQPGCGGRIIGSKVTGRAPDASGPGCAAAPDLAYDQELAGSGRRTFPVSPGAVRSLTVDGVRALAALSERGILVPFDRDHALRHPDAAGWVLGALDLREARSFDDHLQSCRECQAVVAEFQVVAEALRCPDTAAGPPPDLEAKTVAAVQYAVLAASRPPPGKRKASRWWHVH